MFHLLELAVISELQFHAENYKALLSNKTHLFSTENILLSAVQ